MASVGHRRKGIGYREIGSAPVVPVPAGVRRLGDSATRVDVDRSTDLRRPSRRPHLPKGRSGADARRLPPFTHTPVMRSHVVGDLPQQDFTIATPDRVGSLWWLHDCV